LSNWRNHRQSFPQSSLPRRICRSRLFLNRNLLSVVNGS
jgi:hypothetical protein